MHIIFHKVVFRALWIYIAEIRNMTWIGLIQHCSEVLCKTTMGYIQWVILIVSVIQQYRLLMSNILQEKKILWYLIFTKLTIIYTGLYGKCVFYQLSIGLYKTIHTRIINDGIIIYSYTQQVLYLYYIVIEFLLIPHWCQIWVPRPHLTCPLR